VLASIQKMKNIVRILFSIVIGIVTYFIASNFTLSIILTILSFILFWIYSPEKRYWRAFWYVLVAFAVTNNWSIKLYQQLSKGNLELKYEDNFAVTIFLGILLIILPILDFFERKKISKQPNATTIIGDGNTVVQDIENSQVKIRK